MSIVHFFLTPFRNESRALREMRAAHTAFPWMPVVMLAMAEPGLPEHEHVGQGIDLYRLPIRSRKWGRNLLIQFLKLAEWATRATLRAMRLRAQIIQAHSIDALPVGVVARFFTGARLLYDAHELETERNGQTGLRQAVARCLERACMSFVDECIVVSDSIGDWYRKAYPGLRVTVLRNAPAGLAANPATSLDIRADVAPGELVFLYLGVLETGRGIPTLLSAFRALPRSHHLVLVGYGGLAKAASEAAQQSPNIHYYPAVPPDTILAVARQADAGICILDSQALSYRFAMPNKLLEYAAAGLPVIVTSGYPDMERFVTEQWAGWCVSHDLEQISALLAGITTETLREARALIARRPLPPSWETEAEKLVEIYTANLGRR